MRAGEAAGLMALGIIVIWTIAWTLLGVIIGVLFF